MKRKEPVRLYKVKEKKPLIENGLLYGIPIEFIIAILLIIALFLIIIAFTVPCTESGLWYNQPLY